MLILSLANELSPAAGWQYLQNLPTVGGDPITNLDNPDNYIQVASPGMHGDQGTQTGLQYYDSVSGEEYVMPKIYLTPVIAYGKPNTLDDEVDRTMYLQYAPNSTFATTQSVPIALALRAASSQMTLYTDDGQRTSGVSSIDMPQPFVSVYCQPNPIMGAKVTRPIQFPDTYVANCGSESMYSDGNMLNPSGLTNISTTTRQDISDQWKRNPEGRIIWIDDVDIRSPVQGRALGAIVMQPELCMASKQYLMTSACVIGARWANSTSFLQEPFGSTSSDGLVDGGTAVNSLSSESLSSLPQWSQPSITLSAICPQSLSPMTDVQNRSVADNLLRLTVATANICLPNGSYTSDQSGNSQSRPFMHERLLASLVANGMSHAAGATHQVDNGYINSYAPVDPDVRSEAGTGIVLTFQGWVPGFGWNLDGIPIKIALPILIFYCLFASTYGLYTLITGRSSTTWRSISDLMALAMNSTPSSVLKNTSCGIGRTETYRKLVSVREVEEHRRLELVFKQDEDIKGAYRRVAVGRGY